jgi:hypothetical protein
LVHDVHLLSWVQQLDDFVAVVAVDGAHCDETLEVTYLIMLTAM